jgi:hypothetical protein
MKSLNIVVMIFAVALGLYFLKYGADSIDKKLVRGLISPERASRQKRLIKPIGFVAIVSAVIVIILELFGR